MKSAITISLVPEARGGPFVLWDDVLRSCEIAKRCGFDALEVFAPDADTFSRENFAAVLGDQGLLLAAVGTGGGWVRSRLTLSNPEPVGRRAAVDFVRSMIDAAGPWQASVIIGSMQGKADVASEIDGRRSWLVESIADLTAHATAAGCPLLIEPLNRYETNLVNTVADGLQLIERVGSDNLRLLCDVFHMNIEEASIADSLVQAGNRVGHIHFADSNRRAVGFGHIDYHPILEGLRKIGYNGFLSAEVLPLPDSESAAKQTMEAFRKGVGDN